MQFRGAGDPVLHLSNPPGMTREQRRSQLDGLAALNQRLHERAGDPEIETRIAQYEMAFRMQASVPDLVDTSREPEHVLRAVRGGLAQAGNFRGELPAGAAAGGAQCPVHSALSSRLGPSRRADAEAAAAGARHRPACGRPDPRSEAARDA